MQFPYIYTSDREFVREAVDFDNDRRCRLPED